MLLCFPVLLASLSFLLAWLLALEVIHHLLLLFELLKAHAKPKILFMELSCLLFLGLLLWFSLRLWLLYLINLRLDLSFLRWSLLNLAHLGEHIIITMFLRNLTSFLLALSLVRLIELSEWIRADSLRLHIEAHVTQQLACVLLRWSSRIHHLVIVDRLSLVAFARSFSLASHNIL